MITQEEWLSAEATKTLNLSEMDELVRKSQELWNIYEEKKKLASDAYKEAEKVDLEILEALKTAGKRKYSVDGVGTVSINHKAVVRVPASIEDKQAFFGYLRSIDKDLEVSMMTVNSNTLNAWYSRKLEEATEKGILGFSVPGVGQPTMRETLTFRKG